jgi:hypothetical protein
MLTPFERSKSVGANSSKRVPHVKDATAAVDEISISVTQEAVKLPNGFNKFTKDQMRDWASENLTDVWFESDATKVQIKAGIKAVCDA